MTPSDQPRARVRRVVSPGRRGRLSRPPGPRAPRRPAPDVSLVLLRCAARSHATAEPAAPDAAVTPDESVRVQWSALRSLVDGPSSSRPALPLLHLLAHRVVHAAALGLLVPVLFDCSGWLGVVMAGIGPLTELLGPRLRSGLGRARLPPGQAAPASATLPPEFVELVVARELLAALSRHMSGRLLELAQRLDLLATPSQARREGLLACAGLVYECLCAWHDLQRAQTRFCRAHSLLVARIEGSVRPALAVGVIARLRPAIDELLRFFDRVELNQRRRLQRLLLHAAELEQHAARGGAELVPPLRAALAELAVACAPPRPPAFDPSATDSTAS